MAKSSALAVVHAEAAASPMLIGPSSRPANQKSVSDLCLREKYRPIPSKIAM